MEHGYGYWVYYHDGFCENGDEGLEGFEHRDEAESFINNRLIGKHKREQSIKESYVIIKGTRIDIESVEAVTKIKLKD